MGKGMEMCRMARQLETGLGRENRACMMAMVGCLISLPLLPPCC